MSMQQTMCYYFNHNKFCATTISLQPLLTLCPMGQSQFYLFTMIIIKISPHTDKDIGPLIDMSSLLDMLVC